MIPTASSLSPSSAVRTVEPGWALAFACCALAVIAAQPADASATFSASGRVEVAFSPADDPAALVLRTIAAARSSIQVQAYSFTSQPIANALVDARARGVRVEVLVDADMNRRGGKALPKLLAAGVPVLAETRYAAAHNKVIIVDATGPGCKLLTGSYNFSWSAQNRNAENVIVLHDNCAVARHYLDNWQRHRADATRVRGFPLRH